VPKLNRFADLEVAEQETVWSVVMSLKGPIAICYARTDDHAKATAHRFFRWSLAGWPVMAELPDTEGFAAATKNISPDVVADAISCGPDPARHLDAIRGYIEAGFDHIILTQIGPAQEEFFEFFERELSEPLRQSTSTPPPTPRKRAPAPAV
jgi:hypothetical protein